MGTYAQKQDNSMKSQKKKIANRAKRVGAWLVEDHKRSTGGLIYTERASRERAWRMGKMGAASGVRKIDPATGEIIDLVSVREFVAQQPDKTREKVKRWREGKSPRSQKSR